MVEKISFREGFKHGTARSAGQRLTAEVPGVQIHVQTWTTRASNSNIIFYLFFVLNFNTKRTASYSYDLIATLKEIISQNN